MDAGAGARRASAQATTCRHHAPGRRRASRAEAPPRARSEAVVDSPDERILMDFHRELGDEKRREAVVHALEFHVVILNAERPVARIREFYAGEEVEASLRLSAVR